MNHAIHFILASTSLESVLRFIRAPQNAQIYNAIVIALLTAIGLVLCWSFVFLTKRFTEKETANPRKLFLQLCGAHELTTGERRQLESLAGLNGLENPALLMIDASTWHIEELCRAKKLLPKQSERLLKLQKILYDLPRLGAPMVL